MVRLSPVIEVLKKMREENRTGDGLFAKDIERVVHEYKTRVTPHVEWQLQIIFWWREKMLRSEGHLNR